jgi:hypothetical protein
MPVMSWRSAIGLATASARTYGVSFRVWKSGGFWWLAPSGKRYDKERWKVDCLPTVMDGRIKYPAYVTDRHQQGILGMFEADTREDAVRAAFARALYLIAAGRL